MTEQSQIILGDLKKDGKGRTFPICWEFFAAGLCLLKVNNGNAIIEKLKAKERRLVYPLETSDNLWLSGVFRGYTRHRFGVLIVTLEQISRIVLLLKLLILNK